MAMEYGQFVCQCCGVEIRFARLADNLVAKRLVADMCLCCVRMLKFTFFFLCFRSLMVMSRQDEVNKTVEISNVGIYCHHLDEQQGSCDTGGLTETNFSFSHELAHPRDAYLLNPFNVTIFVLVSVFIPHVSFNNFTKFKTVQVFWLKL